MRLLLMAGWALAALAVYFILCFAVRTIIQRRRTGSSGFHGISGQPGSAEWAGGVLFAVAIVLGALAPVADLVGWTEPLAVDGTVTRTIGVVLFFAGLVTTLVAQNAMGRSWRVGVDRRERTELVTAGPFSLVRNPVFAGMIPTALGVALLVPNAVAALGVIALLVAVELQTRMVEEPYLLAAQGEPYREYAARTGRFLPGVGRLR